MKNYKIEKKPIFWNVVLSNGAYSDYSETHYCIAANSPEEAQYLFKLFWQELNKEEKQYYAGLVFENGEKFNPTEKSDEEMDWDTSYGGAQDVSIFMLEVIHIQRLK
jgi:hypothetical protein